MTDATFHSIRATLLRLDAALKDVSEEDIRDAPHAVQGRYLNELNRLAAAPVPEEVVRQLIEDAELTPAVHRISRLKREVGLRLELCFSESVAASPEPWDVLREFVYYPNYLALARMECEGARLRPGDRVVFVGSGPLPLSLICLSTGYGIRGIGIEQEAGHAALSEKAIQRLGLEDRVTIICGNHLALPLRTPSRLIMVGADATPKDEIFVHLARVLDPGQMISYRIYEKGLRRIFDAGSSFSLPPEFQEIARVQPEPPVNNTVVIAVRKK